jgi:hypothetical protein
MRAAWSRSRGWLLWVIAASILTLLAARLPRAQLLHALTTGPAVAVALCSAAVAAAVLLADAWGTRAAFAATGLRCSWPGLLLARGATYLLGLVNFAVGQGGMGLYLSRAGVGPLRTLGTLLFLVGTQVAALAAVGAVGLAADAVAASSGTALAASLPSLAVLAVGFALYLGMLAWKPAWLARRPILAPIFAAGGRGFLEATATRLPHAFLLIFGWWLGLRLWGIPLPPARGLVLLSVAVLVAVLPVAPSGLGTLELTLVQLVSPYAPGSTVAAQRADVLAFSLVYHLFGLAAQALIGLLCLAGMTRRARIAARGGGAAAECVVVPLAPPRPPATPAS